MASLPSECTQAGMSSNPPRKVRIVAKIRGFSEQERKLSTGISAAPWTYVGKPKADVSDSVSITLADPSASRKESYELDGFYEQNDSTELVFSREVKPLVSGMFDGCNATIIACGARGSGKSYLIQGTDEKPGMTAQAMAEILLMAEENGKSVTVSLYEVYQDHVYDLLDPKRSIVSVLEDALGKIQLKGLSKVPVKSISEFHKLYFGSLKAPQKTVIELSRRSHKGLIVYVSSGSENSDTALVGKMSFVDLAGYEDARGKSCDGYNFVENTKINKSLYALQNVVLALNINGSHVPYRESRLTRVLQDSLGVTNKVLMVTCLNPSFCPDSMCMLKLASRSCQSRNSCSTDSTKKSKSAMKQVSRSQMLIKQSQIFRSVSAYMNKKTASKLDVSEKEVIGAGSAIKARNLFAQTTPSTKSSKASSSLGITSTNVPSIQEEKSSSKVPQKDMVPTSVVEQESSLTVAEKDMEPTFAVEKDIYVDSEEVSIQEAIPVITKDTKDLSLTEENKENEGLNVNGGSPPLTVRLRELSNTLKALYSSTPLSVKMPAENQFSYTDTMEPKTPILDYSMRVNENYSAANFNSPWETFSTRSTGMKNSLIQEFLRFINTATKEELKGLKGIGDKRATYILELRSRNLEPFQNLDDLKEIGLSGKQIKEMMRSLAGGLFN